MCVGLIVVSGADEPQRPPLMHAAVTHYFHDGVMIPLGDLDDDDLPWRGRIDAEPPVPRKAQPKVWRFAGKKSTHAVNKHTVTMESSLQVKDRFGGKTE